MKQFWSVLSFWRVLAAAVLVTGIWATVIRFTQGLGAATNLSDQFPWGIWIGFDLLVGVALAAGGFTITATVYIFNLERFRPIVRPTGPSIPDLASADHVEYPLGAVRGGLVRDALHDGPGPRVQPLGVLLSTLHQSSLGTLFVIVPEKMHGLWYTPILPIAFFVSAIAAGLSMVIVESYISARAFGRRLEHDLLEDVGRAIVLVLAIYSIIKLQDVVSRGVAPLLFVRSPESFLFQVELVFGVVLPMIMFSVPMVRRNRGGLFVAALLVVLGLILNRLNVCITGMQGAMGQDYFLEPGMEAAYFPSLLELAVTGSLVVMGCVGFTLAAKYLEVFPESPGLADDHEAARVETQTHPWVRWVYRGVLVALAIVLVEGAVTFDFSSFGGERAGPAMLRSAPTNRLALRLPPDMSYPPGEESPGVVEFSHAMHVDAEEPDCTVCHREAFPLVRRAGMIVPRMTWSGEQLHEEGWCGMCHDGDESFSVEEECDSCHFEP
jgi:c(7)-type cytochrome triheme protein